MRHLLTLILALLLVPSLAQACLGPLMEDSLFFDRSKPLPRDADVAARVILLEVSLSDYYKGAAKAKVVQLVKSHDKRIQQGSVVPMQFVVTSCDPRYEIGDEGLIAAKTGTDRSGHVVLYPYVRQFRDGHLTAPCIGRLQGKIDDDCKIRK